MPFVHNLQVDPVTKIIGAFLQTGCGEQIRNKELEVWHTGRDLTKILNTLLLPLSAVVQPLTVK